RGSYAKKGSCSQHGHTDGGNGGLGPFVAVTAPTPVLGLLQGIVGKYTKDDGNFIGQVQVLDPQGGRTAHIIKMAGLPANDAANGDDGIRLLGFQHPFAAVDELKAPGNLP